MLTKKLLKFYFSADSLNGALDNLIAVNACRSYGEECTQAIAEKLCDLVGAKLQLNKLWLYLDGIINTLSADEREALRVYSLLRCGFSRLKEEDRLSIKRSAMKFTRRARGIGRYKQGIKILKNYYCLT